MREKEKRKKKPNCSKPKEGKRNEIVRLVTVALAKVKENNTSPTRCDDFFFNFFDANQSIEAYDLDDSTVYTARIMKSYNRSRYQYRDGLLFSNLGID